MSTLARKENTIEESGDGIIATSAVDDKSKPDPATETSIGAKACSLCGVAFQTVEEQRSHTRSDLHGYNLKQKIRGANPVSEADFDKLVGGTTPISTTAKTS